MTCVHCVYSTKGQGGAWRRLQLQVATHPLTSGCMLNLGLRLQSLPSEFRCGQGCRQVAGLQAERSTLWSHSAHM